MNIRAHNAPWNAAIEFLIRDGNRTAVPLEFVASDFGEVREPTLRLPYDAAQTLMDDLWNCGLRPTEGAGSAGAMSAVQKHLEDMRTLVFAKGTP